MLVAGLRSKRGASFQILRLIAEGVCRPVISVALALEYEDVLKRKSLLRNLSEADVDSFLDDLFAIANLVPFVLRRRPSLPDPDDERILEVAVQSHAMIVTHNIADFAGAERFGIAVMTPAEFLAVSRE